MEPVRIIGPSSAVPVRAAQYVRMSTEHQQYSIQNQMDWLRAYAAEHGIDIVRTYADEGKSGLSLNGRPALKQLIKDVVSECPDFSVILVYDVSRWGRFQDADEAAHYEFLCRQAGIDVVYCAEQFANDGSPIGTLLKGMKRVMAAEYSRELSAKVHFAQSRVVRLGYLVGGPAGLGFRRLAIDKSGNHRGMLENGEHKAIRSDRVVLVPGPREEVALVRWIFKECASGKSVRSIATALNDRGILTPRGHRWANPTLASLLRNEKYVGNSIWNRKSHKLRKKLIRNPPSSWIRVDGAFAPIVSRELFDKAQEMVARRKEPQPPPDQVMLEALKRLRAKRGRLTRHFIDIDKETPCSSAYVVHFGGLIEAYRRIGYTPERDYSNLLAYRQFRLITRRHAAEAAKRLRGLGKVVTFNSNKWAITVDGQIAVLFMTLRSMKLPSGVVYWEITPRMRRPVDVVAATRMQENNKQALDYLLLPRDELNMTSVRIRAEYAHPLMKYQCETLEPLYRMLAREDRRDAPIREQILDAIEAEARAWPWWRPNGG